MVDFAVIHQRVPARTRALSLGGVIAGHVLLAIGLVLAVQIPHMIEPPVVQINLGAGLLPAPATSRGAAQTRAVAAADSAADRTASG